MKPEPNYADNMKSKHYWDTIIALNVRWQP